MSRAGLRIGVAALVALASALAVAPAGARPGSLDRSFGHGGVADVGFGTRPANGWDSPWAVAVAPDRSIVTAGGPFIVDRRRPAGGPDRAFGVGGTVQLHFPGSGSDVAERVLVQPDGKVVVAGRVGGRCRPHCHNRVGLARLTRSGRLDRSFGNGGFALTPLRGHAVGVAIARAGRIYVAGVSFEGAPELARLRRDGSLDRHFGRGGVAPVPPAVSDAGLADLAVQPDGRALLLTPGHSGKDRPGSPADGMLLRYRGNGSLEREFGRDGMVPIAGTDTPRGARAVAAEPDGGLLVARSLRGRARHVGVLRLRPDGSPDPAYRRVETGTVCLRGEEAFGWVTGADLAILPGGAAALAVSCEGEDLVAVRLDRRGGLDRRFAQSGVAEAVGAASSEAGGGALLAPAPSGGFVVAAQAPNRGGTILARYGRGGLAGWFGQRGVARFAQRADSVDYVRAMAIGPGGRIALAGEIEGARPAVAVLARGGRLLHSVAGEKPGDRESVRLNAVGMQSDGKVVVAGSVESSFEAPGPIRHGLLLMRFGRRGRLDPGFGHGGVVRTRLGADDLTPRALAIQPDGKIVVVGDPEGERRNGAMLRFRRDGSLDRRFGRRGVVKVPRLDITDGVAFGRHGAILAVGGREDGCNSAGIHCRWRLGVFRFRPGGRLDRSFGRGGGVFLRNAFGISVAATAGGIVAVGSRTESQVQNAQDEVQHPAGGLVLERLTASGGLDPRFGGGGVVRTAGPRAPRAATVARDGRIYVAATGRGGFSVAAFAADGSRLAGFGGGGLMSARVGNGRTDAAAIGIQRNGDVLVAGRGTFPLGGKQFAVAAFRGD